MFRPVKSLLLVAALGVCVSTSARAEEKEMAKHKTTQSESWVAFEPMYSTIIDANRPCGMLLVEIGLDIPDPALREDAARAAPILRDYYVRSLTSFTASTVRPWRQPDVSVIAARLQRVTDRALKQTGARVLLGQVAIRITR
ncbi:MAG TPA: hypothetical protein VHL34_15540 [Rhizomicrobium sp.]|jgi:flagellar basal body-associated protein FliL|nr:hypothetical protein [Rhizomicrobium sp.]